MESRIRATSDQYMILLKFMESHGDLGRPKPGCHGRMKADRLWHQLGKLLNSSDGGVVRSLLKWKKVWADWKTKTKKKALMIRREAGGGTGSSSQKQLNLTAAEKRVLGVMGIRLLSSIKTEKEEEEYEKPDKNDPLSPSGDDQVTLEYVNHSDYTDYTINNDVVLDYVPIYSMETSSIRPQPEPTRSPTPHEPTPPPPPVREPTPVPPPPKATATRKITRWRPLSTLHRERLLRAEERAQVSVLQYAKEFAALEATRLQLEVDREKNNHEKEMERLKIESRRLEIEENHNQTLNRLVGVLEKLTEILPQMRPPLQSPTVDCKIEPLHCSEPLNID
ncbi:hypothetical protein PYW08_010929 [Mythimna loreyi]|uniref:Uncharacterized protein n=1 Tax=Mythimna loreyi TaxID=667449 RepID=A0ACC2Q5H0_9NEOP|nr:hypothetical protein PYW08_010929 [Mythimna loreyi]